MNHSRIPFVALQSYAIRYSRGISLIELLIVLSIVSLLTAVGIPTMSKWVQNKSNESALKYLFHLNVYTRTEAIKANDFFTLCPSVDDKNCGGSWNENIIIFRDSNKNEMVDDDEILFKSVTFPTHTPCIEWNRRDRQYVQFKPSGASNGTAGHFKFCESAGVEATKKVVISFNGRTSLRET